MAGDVAEKWRVDTGRHIIRRADYKGKQKQALHLPFDGLTMPALLFVAACMHISFSARLPRRNVFSTEACAPLQIRSCSATQQKNIVTSLKMFLGSFCAPELVLRVLPSMEICSMTHLGAFPCCGHSVQKKHCDKTRCAGEVRCRDHHVDLKDWGQCLDFLGLTDRRAAVDAHVHSVLYAHWRWRRWPILSAGEKGLREGRTPLPSACCPFLCAQASTWL